MDALREFLARVIAVIRRRDREEDFEAELSAHLDLAIQDNLKRGLSAEEARRRALISLGGVDQTRELHREYRGLPVVETIGQDLCNFLRVLRRDAGLALFAVLIVGLGIGASCMVFNVVNALLLRPLPFEDPSRLVWIANGTSTNLSSQTVQVINLQELKTRSRTLVDVAAFSPFYGPGDIHFTGAGEPERVTAVPVLENFFSLLGVEPQIGRLFTAEEVAGSAWEEPRAALLSHRFWQRSLAADPAVVGRPILLDDVPVTVVGVLPQSFDFAAMFAPGSRVDLFVPIPLSPAINRQGNTLALIGRLAPGVSLEAARAEATAIGESIEPVRGGENWRNDFDPRLTPLRERVSGTHRQAVFILAVAVAFVMLLVCVNLSHLLLARASSREKEMAVRVALGAGRGRLIRQMLTESLALSGCGALVGLLLAVGGTLLLARIEAAAIPLLHHVRIDTATLGFALTAALLTGLGFGLAPALRVSAAGPYGALKAGDRTSDGGHRRGWARGSLIVTQIVLACLLLTGTGLLLRSLVSVLEVDLGFESDHVLALRVDPSGGEGGEAEKVYLDEILRTVRALPGVEAAGLTDALPLGQNYGWRNWGVTASGPDNEQDQFVPAHPRIISDGYLAAMNIPLLVGREFTPAEIPSSERVIMVNETMAHTLWPDRDPIGQSLMSQGSEWRVIGVVHDVRYFGPERESGNEFYMSVRVNRVGFGSLDLVIRSGRPPAELMPRVRAALQRVDPDLPVTEFRTVQGLVDRAMFARRSVVWLLSGFALFALILAALGIYGVISYAVSRRRREIGIWMALGESVSGVRVRVLMQTVRLACAGIILGAAASWLAARALQGLLFEVTVSDPATYTAAILLLTLVSALAGWLPARRASQVDPLEALRVE